MIDPKNKMTTVLQFVHSRASMFILKTKHSLTRLLVELPKSDAGEVCHATGFWVGAVGLVMHFYHLVSGAHPTSESLLFWAIEVALYGLAVVLYYIKISLRK